ncbi:MAG: PQQ-dependent sugar dehydrogenase [Xanthobacteraceae bacterium]|jgi:glucose/arabinose dehydrogenase
MRHRSSAIIVATASLALTCAAALAPGWAQRNTTQAPGQLTDPASLPDQELGRKFTVKAEDLPPPRSGPVVSNRPLSLPYQGQTPRVPEGFTATAFAVGLEHPRRLLVLPNGDVLVAEQRGGYVTLLRDEDGDGKAEWIQRHIEGLNGPYGLAWKDGFVLVADQDGIWKVPHRLGALRPGLGAVQQKAADVPPDQRKPTTSVVGEQMITKKGVFGIVQGHANRHLAIDPKTGAMFVGVGSSGNIGVEPEVKASIQRFEADGSGQTTFASGLRNATALTFHPETGELFTVVQERDGLGDKLVPDFLTHVQKGAFYGWPYAYIGQNPQPGFAQLKPDKVKASVVPDLLFEAHSSAMDIVFYEGQQFPAEYRGSALVALKGSWNRSEPTGYKVVRVPFKDGKPVGHYENFAAGFWTSGLQRAEVWGRPAALAVAKDGALLIADDTGGTIWRISYSAPARQTGTPGGTTGAPPR